MSCQMRASTGRKQEAVTVTREHSTRVLAWSGALPRPAEDDLLAISQVAGRTSARIGHEVLRGIWC
jgi:hypothetical protein